MLYRHQFQDNTYAEREQKGQINYQYEIAYPGFSAHLGLLQVEVGGFHLLEQSFDFEASVVRPKDRHGRWFLALPTPHFAGVFCGEMGIGGRCQNQRVEGVIRHNREWYRARLNFKVFSICHNHNYNSHPEDRKKQTIIRIGLHFK